MSPLLAHRQSALWLAALATTFMLLVARPAHGVTLSWNAFRGAPGSSDALDLACATGGYHHLFADFSVPETFPDLVRMEVWIDLGEDVVFPVTPPPLPPFWHFEGAGCNPHGMLASLTMPPDPAGRENPWGEAGGNATAYVSYRADNPPGRGVIRIQIVRAIPTTLIAGQRYFAFRLVVNSCYADACEGCGLSGGFRVSFAFLTSATGQTTYLYPYAGEDVPIVCFNTNGWCGIADPVAFAPARPPGTEEGFQPAPQVETLCGPTPARSRTWGAIKTLYR